MLELGGVNGLSEINVELGGVCGLYDNMIIFLLERRLPMQVGTIVKTLIASVLSGDLTKPLRDCGW